MKNTIAIISGFVLVLTLSFNAFADTRYHSDNDHDPVGSSYGEHTSGKPSMINKMKAMQAEMQTIINTEDKAKRLALFAAHKLQRTRKK